MPGQFHHFGARVSDGAQMSDELFMRNVGIFCKGARQIQVGGGILIAPERRGNRGDHQRDLPIRETEERGGTAFENIRVRTLCFPGKCVEGGQGGHAAGCSRKNTAAEAQRFR